MNMILKFSMHEFDLSLEITEREGRLYLGESPWIELICFFQDLSFMSKGD